MPPEIIELLRQPHLLIAALAIAGLVGMFIERFLSDMRRQAWRERNRWRKQKRGSGGFDYRQWQPQPDIGAPKPFDAADQLRIVMGAHFTIQSLLNKSEARLFKELDRIVIDCNPAWQVMAQVSLGEILRSNDEDAYRCINSKRVDLLLVDGECRPRHVVEYQGTGHHQGTAAARDAIKKEALRRAGIGYHEVLAGRTTPSDLRRLVERLVDRPSVAQQPPGAPLTERPV